MHHVTRLCPHCFVGTMALMRKFAPMNLFHDPVGMAGVQVSVQAGRVVTTLDGSAVSSSKEVACA